MIRTLRQSGLSGLLAGLLVAVLYLVDYGPGNSLHRVPQWFGIDSQSLGKFIGFLLLIVLGGIFGLLFGFIVERWRPRLERLERWLLTGLGVGIVFWLIVVLIIGSGLNHLHMTFGDFLFTFIPLLVYGLLLGSIAFSWRGTSLA